MNQFIFCTSVYILYFSLYSVLQFIFCTSVYILYFSIYSVLQYIFCTFPDLIFVLYLLNVTRSSWSAKLFLSAVFLTIFSTSLTVLLPSCFLFTLPFINFPIGILHWILRNFKLPCVLEVRVRGVGVPCGNYFVYYSSLFRIYMSIVSAPLYFYSLPPFPVLPQCLHSATLAPKLSRPIRCFISSTL